MGEPRTPFETALLEAVEEGIVERVKKLLKSNIKKLKDDRYFDYHLIIKALDSNHIELAKLLLKKGFRVYKASESNQEKTILHVATAIQPENKDLIKTLLEKGASLDILSHDEQNMTPLHLAIDARRPPIVKLFLSKIDPKSLDKENLLHYAIRKNKTKMVELLIEKGVSMKKRNEENLTPFCIALENEKFEILDILLSEYSMINAKSYSYDNIAVVCIAITRGNLNIVKNYTESGLPIDVPLKVNTGTWPCLNKFSGLTFLHLAVKHDKLEIVEFLLSIGANIFVQDENGSTPLHIAFEKKDTWRNENKDSIIQLLLKANTKFNSNPTNKHGLSHFHVACTRFIPTYVEHFLKLGVSINQPVNSECHLYEGFSPLHFAAKFQCIYNVELLLPKGVDVKQKDSKEMTALHVAAKEPCLKVVNLLLQYGADAISLDSCGNTPVHLAFKNSNNCIVDLLLSVSDMANSNPTNSNGLSHFHIACTGNNVSTVKRFIENGACLNTCVPINSSTDEQSNYIEWRGYSPLHFAVYHHKAKVIQLLLHKGANIDLEDINGATPVDIAHEYYDEVLYKNFTWEYMMTSDTTGSTLLHTIAWQIFSSDDIISLIPTFAQISEYINSQDSKGVTAHHVACDKGNSKALDILLKYGADINIEDNNGKTCCCYLYEKCLESLKMENELSWHVYQMMDTLKRHIVKMNVLGLPVSEKVILSRSGFCFFLPISDQNNVKFIDNCQAEVQILKDTKIHANCTLYDVMFKDENALAQIVNNPTFEDIVYSELFEYEYPIYWYFIDSQFKTGVDRADLLQKAKCVLNDLAQLNLPDICSENICKYFKNHELEKSMNTLRDALDMKKKKLDVTQPRACRADKRQKVD